MDVKKTVALGHGEVRQYPLTEGTLHVWLTGDAMNDACFLFETDAGLVGLESPPFRADVAAWRDYVAARGKPLTDVLIDAHPAGGRWFGAAVSHATAGARAAIESGPTRALTLSLAKAFGPDFDADLAPIDRTLASGPGVIGGISLEVEDDGIVYDLGLPKDGIIYTHMLGADTHSLFAGRAAMDHMLQRLESLRASGWRLILSGHHAPEDQADVAAKIAYVETVRGIADQSRNRQDFMQRVKRAFPALKGENYLEMSAASLFAQ